MTTKAAVKRPAKTKGKPARAETGVVDTKVSAARIEEQEPVDQTGWVYRCSCGKDYDTVSKLGGHCQLNRKDKSNHKGIGFGPPREVKGSPVVAGNGEVAELYVSDKDRGIASKAEEEPKDKGGRPKGAVGAPGRVTGDVNQAAFIVVTPKEFRTQSSLIWRAQRVSEIIWGWPRMEPGDFIDTYLYYSFRQFGVGLDDFYLLEDRKDGEGKDGIPAS